MDKQLEIIGDGKTMYGFTLRKVKGVTKFTWIDRHDMYEKHIEWLKRNCTVEDYVFETKNGLHVHGVLSCVHGSEKLLRKRGWHLRLEEIWNRAGWQSYITKECYNDVTPDVDPDVECLTPEEQRVEPPKERLFCSSCIKDILDEYGEEVERKGQERKR